MFTKMLFMRFFLLIFFLGLSTGVGAQSLRAYERAGDAAFKQHDYSAAAEYYNTVLQREARNSEVLWKYAESTRMFNAYEEAERAYKRIGSLSKFEYTYPLLEFRLGEISRSKGEYDQAIEHFNRFLDAKSKASDAYREVATQQIEACEMAKTLKAEPNAVVVTRLGKEVNSPYSDFAPLQVGDTLFFSSYRFDRKRDFSKPKRKITKVLMSVKGGRAKEPGRGFPTMDTAHVAHTALAPEGRYLFFTKCNNISAGEIRCELWLTVLDRRFRWLPPVRLPEPINMKGFTSTHPSVGYDSLYGGPMLYFVSDRPGGKGKLDIWSVPLDTIFFCACNLPLPGKKIGNMPPFDEPINVEALNTEGNDISPFFHGPSQRLYFSNDSRAGMGGYDIFSSNLEVKGFAEPENAGAGLNSSYNDLYLTLNRDGRKGYLSSNRPGSLYLDPKNKACCNDIYSFTLPEPPPPIPADTISRIVVKTPEPNVQIPPVPTAPEPPKLVDFVGLPLYFDNDEPDKRTRRTNTSKTYGETAEIYLARQSEYVDRFSERLRNAEKDTAEVRVNDFFENEVRRGYDRLNELCDLLLRRLEEGEKIEVLIKGFTSPRAQSDYNLALGKRRISSVRNHFERYNEGVLMTYIKSGMLSIEETSFGETTARSGISDNLNDERNSIYHPNAARERRVEIVQIKQN